MCSCRAHVVRRGYRGNQRQWMKTMDDFYESVTDPCGDIAKLATAVRALSEAQERLRVAGMADKRLDCKVVIGRLVDQLMQHTAPTTGVASEEVPAVNSD